MQWVYDLPLGEAVDLLTLIEEENYKERMFPIWARSGLELTFDQFCDRCRQRPVDLRESDSILADVDAMMGGV